MEGKFPFPLFPSFPQRIPLEDLTASLLLRSRIRVNGPHGPTYHPFDSSRDGESFQAFLLAALSPFPDRFFSSQAFHHVFHLRMEAAPTRTTDGFARWCAPFPSFWTLRPASTLRPSCFRPFRHLRACILTVPSEQGHSYRCAAIYSQPHSSRQFY